MSLSSAISAAMSGLSANSRRAELISSNIANATTPGYMRREIVVASNLHGAGASVTGIARDLQPALLADQRLAAAASAGSGRVLDFLEATEATLGTADGRFGLAQAVSAFDAALIQAAGQPHSETLLARAIQTATDLATRIRAAATENDQERAKADARIGQQVDLMNEGLQRIEVLNTRIVFDKSLGRDSSAAEDERQKIVSDLSAIIPLREVDRGGGRIALFATSGAQFLDGRPARLEFTPAANVTADMAIGDGLSGLLINGVSVDPAGRLIAGGSLAADFALRDHMASDQQRGLDALAQDLVARFAATGVDPSLPPGAEGLFRIADTPMVAGLAQTLHVNPLVDPAVGGDVARVRDGLGATSPGPVGDPAQILRLHDALGQVQPAGAGNLPEGDRAFADHVSALLSAISGQRLVALDRHGEAGAELSAFTQALAANGVNSDFELQQLLVVEKAFAANARVLQAADEMMATLLGI